MRRATAWRRKITNGVMLAGTVLCAVAILVPLLSVLWMVVAKGAGGIDLAFFTRLPKPVGEAGGGLANGLLGSAMIVGTACLISIPAGLLAGIYLCEFGRGRLGWWVRFCADVMTGTPSIVAGTYIYALVVVPMHGASALAGSLALSLLMFPMVTRTTEEMLLLVPNSLRDGAVALGATRARALFGVLLPAALPGVVTGVLLAAARIAGETAPLLHTSMNNVHLSTKLTDGPMASLPVQIYTYAVSPYDDWQQQAWAGALVLVTATLLLSVLARVATRGRYRPTG